MSNLSPGIAQKYTTSILNIASNGSEIKNLISELQLIYDRLSITKDFWYYLCSQWIPSQEKLLALDKISHILGLSQLANAVMSLLINNHRLSLINDIIKQLKIALCNIENYIEVEINTAQSLDLTTKNSIQQNLENIFNIAVKAEFKIDQSLIGGLVIYGDSIMLDLSFKGRMSFLKREFNIA